MATPTESWQSEEGGGPMWLRDYLREHFPNCRTMTFGYDANMKNHGTNTIADYSDELLAYLEKARDTEAVSACC